MLVFLILLKIKFGHAQNSVSKIGISMPKQSVLTPAT